MSHSPDREVCLCFHVPLGKLAKFCRLEKPKVPSQLSNCYSAGTGCGWCIPFLEQIYEQVRRGEEPVFKMSAEEYRMRRQAYRATGQRDHDTGSDKENPASASEIPSGSSSPD